MNLLCAVCFCVSLYVLAKGEDGFNGSDLTKVEIEFDILGGDALVTYNDARKSKAEILYAQKRKIVAYKDAENELCLLEKIRKSKQHGEFSRVYRTSVTPLEKDEAQKLAGRNVVAFCGKNKLILLKPPSNDDDGQPRVTRRIRRDSYHGIRGNESDVSHQEVSRKLLEDLANAEGLIPGVFGKGIKRNVDGRLEAGGGTHPSSSAKVGQPAGVDYHASIRNNLHPGAHPMHPIDITSSVTITTGASHPLWSYPSSSGHHYASGVAHGNDTAGGHAAGHPHLYENPHLHHQNGSQPHEYHRSGQHEPFPPSPGNFPPSSSSKTQSGTQHYPPSSGSKLQPGGHFPSSITGDFQPGSTNFPPSSRSKVPSGTPYFPPSSMSKSHPGTSHYPPSSSSKIPQGTHYPSSSSSRDHSSSSHFPSSVSSKVHPSASHFPPSSTSTFQSGAFPPSSTSKLQPGAPQHSPSSAGNVPPGTSHYSPSSVSKVQPGPPHYPPSSSSKVQPGPPHYPPSSTSKVQPGLPHYTPSSTSKVQPGPPYYPPSSSSKVQPGPSHYPPSSTSNVQTGSPHYPPSSTSKLQPGVPHYPPSSTSKVQPGPQHYPPSSTSKVPPGPSYYPPSSMSKVQPGPQHYPPSSTSKVQPGSPHFPPSSTSKVQPGPQHYPPSSTSKVQPGPPHYPPSSTSKVQPGAPHYKLSSSGKAEGPHFAPSSTSKVRPSPSYYPPSSFSKSGPHYPPSATSKQHHFPPPSAVIGEGHHHGHQNATGDMHASGSGRQLSPSGPGSPQGHPPSPHLPAPHHQNNSYHGLSYPWERFGGVYAPQFPPSSTTKFHSSHYGGGSHYSTPLHQERPHHYPPSSASKSHSQEPFPGHFPSSPSTVGHHSHEGQTSTVERPSTAIFQPSYPPSSTSKFHPQDHHSSPYYPPSSASKSHHHPPLPSHQGSQYYPPSSTSKVSHPPPDQIPQPPTDRSVHDHFQSPPHVAGHHYQHFPSGSHHFPGHYQPSVAQGHAPSPARSPPTPDHVPYYQPSSSSKTYIPHHQPPNALNGSIPHYPPSSSPRHLNDSGDGSAYHVPGNHQPTNDTSHGRRTGQDGPTGFNHHQQQYPRRPCQGSQYSITTRTILTPSGVVHRPVTVKSNGEGPCGDPGRAGPIRYTPCANRNGPGPGPQTPCTTNFRKTLRSVIPGRSPEGVEDFGVSGGERQTEMLRGYPVSRHKFSKLQAENSTGSSDLETSDAEREIEVVEEEEPQIAQGGIESNKTKDPETKEEEVREGDVLEPGDRILGKDGYTISEGFRGRIVAVTGQIGKTRDESGKGTEKKTNFGQFRYSTELGRYVKDNSEKTFSNCHGELTFTCSEFFGSNGRAKICRPNPRRNPDGTPC